MNDDTPMMICDWCGKEFPADARACVEAQFSAEYQVNEGEEWKGREVPFSSEDFSPEMHEHMKEEMGLDDSQLNELLRTGKVGDLGAIVCVQCQDEGVEVD